MLDCSKAWPLVKDVLSASHFARADHRLIFASIASLVEDIGIADGVVVVEDLNARGQLNAIGGDIGGREYIAQLIRDVPSALTAGVYAKRVRDAAGGAEVIDFMSRTQARVRLGAAPAEAARMLVEEAERLRRDYGDAQEPKKSERRPMRWAELATQEPPAREWSVSHWLTTGPTLMAGVGGVGKSLLAQTIATALVLGRNFIDEVREPVPAVLMWACEDEHDEIWRRQIAICKFFDVPLSAVQGKLIIEPRLGLENTLYSLAFGAPVWTPLRDELREQLNDYHADTLFLDNIAQTYGAKENERHPVTSFLNGIAGLAPDLSAVVMGHPAKAEGSEFSGSTAWENAVRMRWYMGYSLPDVEPEEGAEDRNVRYLAKRKANYSERDYRKFEFIDGLFMPEVRGPGDGFAARWGGADRGNGAKDCILYALGEISKVGIRVTDGKTSPDYLPKKMREMSLASDFTSRELTSALSQLRLAGKIIEKVVGQYADRHAKTGLAIA